jgi:TP901-1 family phage major tail protein
MSAVRGKDVLLKIDTTGGGVYGTVGGIRARSIKIDNETVDITSSDSSNEWQELLASAGVKKISITGSGVLKRDAVDTNVRQAMTAGTIKNWQIVIPSFFTLTGLFQVASIEYSADHNDTGKFSISLESAGEPAFS